MYSSSSEDMAGASRQSGRRGTDAELPAGVQEGEPRPLKRSRRCALHCTERVGDMSADHRTAPDPLWCHKDDTMITLLGSQLRIPRAMSCRLKTTATCQRQRIGISSGLHLSGDNARLTLARQPDHRVPAAPQ